MQGTPAGAHAISHHQPQTSDIPLAIWPTAQVTSQHQRRGRSLPESNRHPGKMLPAIARRGGYLVTVTKSTRAEGALRDLAVATVALCQDAGLAYWQHVIGLLATIRDGELVPRPSFWQRLAIRRALARGDRTQLVSHEDVLVFRKPPS